MPQNLFDYTRLLKYEHYFESPYDLLIAPGLSPDQKLAVIELWNARRISFLYTHCHEGSWDTDDIALDLEICRDILHDPVYRDVFREMGKISLKPKRYQ